MIEGDSDVSELEAEERREYDRSRLIVDVFFDGQDATGIASTKDISGGGLYMNTQADLPEGAILTIRIPMGEDSPVVVQAEVIYRNEGNGVGLRFRNLTETDRERIQGEAGKR